MGYALSTTLHTTFEDAVERTRTALADQSFGVLMDIDMRFTLKAKLGEDIADYTILGACNSPLARRAVTADRQIGLLLPCNVAVRQDPENADTIIVDAIRKSWCRSRTPPACARWPTTPRRGCARPSRRCRRSYSSKPRVAPDHEARSPQRLAAQPLCSSSTRDSGRT